MPLNPDPYPLNPKREVAGLFLKLGFIAFGGPAAHIALMRQEVVQRRKWLSEQEFLDLLGASNLIPGPTSTELAIYLGYTRAGPLGLLLAGGLFILPAMLLVLAFAWAYVQYGSTLQAAWLLYGIKPVIIAVIAQAIYGLLRTAVKSWQLGLAVAAAIALYLLGLNPLIPLFGLGLLVMLVENRRRLSSLTSITPKTGLPMLLLPLSFTAAPAAGAVAGFSLVALFLTFLKIGATLYGSGYVLLAFLRDDFVHRLGWLTDRQIIDAVAVGQFTPGPVFTTATFIGYITGGWVAAVVATVAIFLPGFVFVAIVYPLVPKLRASPWTSAFLNGANAAAIGLMAAVAGQLGQSSIVDALTAVLAIAAAILLIRFRLNSAWLVLGGGAAGLAAHVLNLV
ncbi:MAG TPA: chromate efflux transporter [Chloroflexota bacterium]|nr:chromate efflux transporter [Chloroflexota bacterium]